MSMLVLSQMFTVLWTLMPTRTPILRMVRSAEDIRTRLEKERRKLDGWRYTLGEMSRTQPAMTSTATPERRAARRRGA
jgi:hypothetical protein